MSACNAGDLDSVPGSGRSLGEGNGYPLQYHGLENSMNCVVRGVAKSQTQLRDFHFLSFKTRRKILARMYKMCWLTQSSGNVNEMQ